MPRFLRAHILAWTITAAIVLLTFAAGPLVFVATTNLMLDAGADFAAWTIALLVSALKLSVVVSVVLTAIHLVRSRSSQ